MNLDEKSTCMLMCEVEGWKPNFDVASYKLEFWLMKLNVPCQHWILAGLERHIMKQVIALDSRKMWDKFHLCFKFFKNCPYRFATRAIWKTLGMIIVYPATPKASFHRSPQSLRNSSATAVRSHTVKLVPNLLVPMRSHISLLTRIYNTRIYNHLSCSTDAFYPQTQKYRRF